MALEIGKINTLTVTKQVNFGVYLDGHEYGEILLPSRYVPDHCNIGTEIPVFIYHDSEDRLIATTESPKAMIGDFCRLKTVMITSVGAFLDWGLSKDLLVPFREQKQKMIKGKFYFVYLYIDEATGRIVASSKIDKFLISPPSTLNTGDPVTIMIAEITDLGFKVIINNKYPGIIYKNEVYKQINIGQTLQAYIKKIRGDKKIDITLSRPGFENVTDLSEIILSVLEKNHGFINVNDKTDPARIYALFGVSKKTFKKAIGTLYRNKRILIMDDGIKLI